MSFGRKISFPGSNLPYTVHYPHTIPAEDRIWNGDLIYASIDPAMKNYALRIEKRGAKIESLAFTKVNLQPHKVPKGEADTSHFNRLTDFLLLHRELFQQCHYIIIERQLPTNYNATRIAQHTITLLSFLLRDQRPFATIIELNPTHKGKVLGYKPKVSGDLKDWAVTTAREMLTQRGDEESLAIMDGFKRKQDDLADTVIQIEALIRYWGDQ